MGEAKDIVDGDLHGKVEMMPLVELGWNER